MQSVGRNRGGFPGFVGHGLKGDALIIDNPAHVLTHAGNGVSGQQAEVDHGFSHRGQHIVFDAALDDGGGGGGADGGIGFGIFG